MSSLKGTQVSLLAIYCICKKIDFLEINEMVASGSRKYKSNKQVAVILLWMHRFHSKIIGIIGKQK